MLFGDGFIRILAQKIYGDWMIFGLSWFVNFARDVDSTLIQYLVYKYCRLIASIDSENELLKYSIGEPEEYRLMDLQFFTALPPEKYKDEFYTRFPPKGRSDYDKQRSSVKQYLEALKKEHQECLRKKPKVDWAKYRIN